MVTATDPAGEWSKPVQVISGRAYEDPCPLWDDDDGKACAWSMMVGLRSRNNRNNMLTLVPLKVTMPPTPIGDWQVTFVGGIGFFKVTGTEGPKFYAMNGYYWIFAPVGGVAGPRAARYSVRRTSRDRT